MLSNPFGVNSRRGERLQDVPLQKRIRDAIKSGDDSGAIALLTDSPDQLVAVTVFGTWMHVAATHDRLRVIEHLVGARADMNARGGILGGTPLNEAVSAGHLAVVEYLLSVGAEMETRAPEVNPLFSAIHCGRADIVLLLLNHGIDPSIRYTGESMRRMDALAFARERGQSEIARLLEARSRA
jgi:ankyrin repeat protein